MIVLSQSALTKGGLRLFLSNNLGQLQDAALVRWTIYSATGELISGRELHAVRESAGIYYAPWRSDVVSGTYRIIWNIQDTSISTPRQVVQPFFVVDPGDYDHGLHLPAERLPVTGGLTFLTGAFLGSEDLILVLRDGNGNLQDAYSVLWYVKDSRGCAVTSRTFAAHVSTGIYYAPWVVIAGTGEYEIVWEFQQYSDSPLQQASQGFSVLGAVSPFMILTGPERETPVIITGYDRTCLCNVQTCSGSTYTGSPIWEVESLGIPLSVSCSCNDYSGLFPCSYSCSVPSTPVLAPLPCCGECCDYEVMRQVHLPLQMLPLAGAFTTQNQFSIPTRIRRVTFYLTYTRGAADGYAIFRLLWGNGVEENPEAILNIDSGSGGPVWIGQQLRMQDLHGPAPIDSSPLDFSLYATVPGGATTVRLVAAEKGALANPGMLAITLTAST